MGPESAYTGKVTGFGQGRTESQPVPRLCQRNFDNGGWPIHLHAGKCVGYERDAYRHRRTHSASVTLVGHYVQADFHAENIGGTLAITDPTLIYTGAVFLSGGLLSP